MNPWIRWPHLPYVFGVLSLVFGNLLVVFIPPFCSADEPLHFYRAYEISDGSLITRQTDTRGVLCYPFPKSLYKIWLPFSRLAFRPAAKTSFQQIRDASRIPLDAEDKMLIGLPTTSHYSPVCYLPQCLGIVVGRALGCGPLTLMYLGREGNILAWTLMGYLALRCAPAIARPLFLLLLMPMSIYVAATNSADAPTNAIAILFTAIVCRYAAEPGNSIGLCRWTVLLLLSVGICLCKFAYAPLLLLLLLIPAGNFGSRKDYAIKLAVLIAISAAAWATWTYFSSARLNSQIRDLPGVSAPAQLQFLEQNPLRFGPVLWNTICAQGRTILKLYVGLIGWYDVIVPGWLAAAYIAILFLACWPASNEPLLPRPIKTAAIVLPAVLSSLLIIALLSYLYWTPIGAAQIDGMHGRYLIPLSPAVFILFCAIICRARIKLPFDPRAIDAVISIISISVCVYFVISVWARFYG